MSPRRILLAADAVGGVWSYAAELAAGLARHGLETVLAVPGPAPSSAQRAEIAGIPGLRLRRSDLPLEWQAEQPGQLALLANWIDTVARADAVDLVHLNGAALAPLLAAAPVVVTQHSCLATWWRALRSEPLPPAWRWQVEATAAGLATADAVIAPSRAFADALRAAYPGIPGPAVIHNGRARLAPPRAPKAPVVMTAGRLWDDAKNLAVLERATSAIAWPVLAAGPTFGPNGTAVELSAVQPLGTLPSGQLQERLAESTIFVSLARYEPFGLAVLEAAAAGNALVLADIPTFRELWQDVACFVPADDPAAVAAAVNQLIAEPARCAALAEQARLRARRYPARRMVDATLALYRSLGQRALAPATIAGTA